MLIDKNGFKVNGKDYAKYLVEIKFGYHKIWGTDTGRNFAGTMSGTLKGIFPKFTLQFAKLTKSELEAVAGDLNMANQSITYYDPELKINKTITTYSNDWEIVNRNIISNNSGKNEGFTVSFISTKRR